MLIVNNFVTEDSSSSARGLGLEQKKYQGQGSHKERSNSSLILPPLKSAIAIQPPAQPGGSRCEFIFENNFNEYTTALPQIRPSAKRTSAGRECSKAVYQRLLKKEEFSEYHVPSIVPSTSMSCDCIGRCREGFCPCFRLNTACTSACQNSSPTNCHAECENTLTARRFSSRLSELQAAGEDCFLQDHNFRSESEYSDHFEALIDGQWVEYVQFAGDPEIAAIFVRHNSGTWNHALSSVTSKEVDMKQLISLFTAGSVSADRFLEYLNLSVLESRENCTRTRRKFPSGPVEVKDISSIGLQDEDEEASRRSLSCNYLYQSHQALATAAEVYKLLPGATVDISVIKKTMSDWKWTKALFDNGADDHADIQL
jgi:hypothetical protein